MLHSSRLVKLFEIELYTLNDLMLKHRVMRKPSKPLMLSVRYYKEAMICSLPTDCTTTVMVSCSSFIDGNPLFSKR